MKKLFLSYLIRFVFGAIALGVGIWYISSSLGGASLSYTSMDTFMNSIGAADGNIANASGCFLCGYVNDLFGVLGNASEKFWAAILNNLWILMVVGFGIFLFIHTIKYFYKAMTDAAAMDGKEQKFAFAAWFDPVWRTGVRVMIVGAIIGAFGMGGVDALKVLGDIVIQPVMYIGTQLSMVATGVINSANCVPAGLDQANAMAPVSNAFMCIVGNINTVMLAGAAGGFALMNYAWMGLGGGVLTWIAGLLTVMMFVVIGFDLFFQILSVIFKLVFVVIFLPIFVAATAFEKTWKTASGVLKRAIDMLVNAAVKVIAISLKVVIIYAIVSFAGSEVFPGAGIFPPLLQTESHGTESDAVHAVFAKCESVATIDGEIDKDLFHDCFEIEKATVSAQYPHAFDFMRDGWGFLILMIGLFFLYIYVLSPRIDKMLAETPSFLPFKKTGESEKGGLDDFGGEMKKFGKLAWKKPQDWLDKLVKEK